MVLDIRSPTAAVVAIASAHTSESSCQSATSNMVSVLVCPREVSFERRSNLSRSGGHFEASRTLQAVCQLLWAKMGCDSASLSVANIALASPYRHYVAKRDPVTDALVEAERGVVRQADADADDAAVRRALHAIAHAAAHRSQPHHILDTVAVGKRFSGGRCVVYR